MTETREPGSTLPTDLTANQETMLDPSGGTIVIEEILPASVRKPKRARGERPLLEVKGLHTSFHTRDGVVRAVDGIDFHVDRGEIMGLVGESGCGKSVTSLSIMRLVAKPGRIEGGEILFDGQDLLKVSEREMQADPRRTDQHDLPAAHVLAEPGLGRRPADRGGPAHPPRAQGQGRQRIAPWSCCAWSGSPIRRAVCARSPTRCRAGWPSAS